MSKCLEYLKKNWAFLLTAVVIAGACFFNGFHHNANAEGALDSPKLKVLLLGDSYTAGNGARKFSGQTDNFGPKGCYRSNSNWGSQYVNHLKSESYNVTLVNRACSGAVSNDLLFDNDTSDVQTLNATNKIVGIDGGDNDMTIISKLHQANYCNQPPTNEEYYRINLISKLSGTTIFECRRYIKAQLESVDSSVDLVLMTLGGNDINFADIVSSCFAPIKSSGKDCAKQNNTSSDALISKDPGSYQSNMQLIFSKLREQMRSDAKVVLLNYPYLAKNDNYEIGNRFDFGTYRASENVRSFGRSGDTIQRSLIPPASNAQANIYYFDRVKDHFVGHEPDMSDPIFNNIDRWINTFNNRLTTDWFHFNPKGHEEVAHVLKDELTNTIGKLPAHSKTDYDVTFIFNESGDADWYGRDDVYSKKMLVSKITNKIQQQSASARFSLIGYNLWVGSGGRTGPKEAITKDFTTDLGAFNVELNKFAYPLGETSPGALRDAINLANSQKWRPGVKKIIYIIGKTKADDGFTLLPELYSDALKNTNQYAMASIILVPLFHTTTETDDGASYLATQTGGTILRSDVPTTYSYDEVSAKANNQALNTPYAWAGEAISTAINQPVTLDGSGSYDGTGIVKYEWDVNNDGVYDLATTSPTIQYTFTQEYQGTAILQVTNAAGGQSTAELYVTATTDGDVIPDNQDNCPADWNEDQADADNDGIGDVCDSSPGIDGYQDPSSPTDTSLDNQPALSNESSEISTDDTNPTISETNTYNSQLADSSIPKPEQSNIVVVAPVATDAVDRIITSATEDELPEATIADYNNLADTVSTTKLKYITDNIDRHPVGVGFIVAGGSLGLGVAYMILRSKLNSGTVWHINK